MKKLSAFAVLVAVSACSAPGQQAQIASASADESVEVGSIEILPIPLDPNRVAVSRELREVDESIDNARTSGRLSKREGKKARKQVGIIAGEADRLGSDGLSDMEANSLEISARGVESLINAPAVPN